MVDGHRPTARRSPRIAEVESLLLGRSHFVRIRCEEGTTGIGQSACWAYPEAVHAVVGSFREYLVGRDAFEIERHWQHLYRMGPFRSAVIISAISAVDIALWDLKGKRLEVPVYELLGGKVRDRIRLHALLLGTPPIEELTRSALDAVGEGASAVKFEPLPPDHHDLALPRLVAVTRERVEAVREAVGPDVDLILELHRGLSSWQAVAVIEALREVRPLFVEDPVPIDDVASQAEVARRVEVPLGLGERCNSLWEFNELLAAAGPQYLRADVGQSGGVTHCRRIAALAEAHHATVSWHNYLGPVLTAASVQLDACVPNVVTQEYFAPADEGPAARGFETAVRREGGELVIPDRPGLGVELDEAAVGELDPLGRPLWQIPTRRDGSVAWSA